MSSGQAWARLRRAAFIGPAEPSRLGDVTWVAFVAAQVTDGALTYVGIRAFGPSIEGNPLLAWLIAVAGAGLALFGAKTFALGCGTVLHLHGMHRSLAVLTTVYVGTALWAWIIVLWPGVL